MSEVGNRQVYPPALDLRESDPLRHSILMREASEVLVGRSDEGQQLSCVYANRDFESRTPILCLNSMFVDSGMAELKYAAYHPAAAFPDRPILILDLPAHGRSGRLTDSQFAGIVNTKSLEPVVKAEAEAAKRRLPDMSEAVVYGESAGALIALDFVKQIGKLGVKPEAILGVEPAGLESRPSVDVHASYFLIEPRIH
jgi:hypothetical protein